MLHRAIGFLRGTWRTIQWGVADRSRHRAARLKRLVMPDAAFIGITGSAGKTTTKDLVVGMLALEGEVRSRFGSPNDSEVTDRLVLAMRRSERWCVAEIGATGPGSLDRSLRTLKPHIGVLTIVAQEHYTAFRDLDPVAAEKRKIVDAVSERGIVVVNVDDPRVREIARQARARVIGVGAAEDATIRLLEASSSWPEPLTLRIRYEGAEYLVRTSIHGRHLALPVLCALGVGLAAGMSIERAIEGVARAQPTDGRMQLVDGGDGVSFIRDDFKAPEWSFDAPLDYLREARAARKIAVIGTISDSSIEDKRRYGRAARKALEVADLVILVGSHTMSRARARNLCDDGRLIVYRSVRDAAEYLKRELRSGDLVLLKGTNKQDHLIRIILHRTKPVKCWDMTCGRMGFCGERCKQVHVGPPAGSSVDDAEIRPWLDRDQRAARPIVIGIGNPGSEYLRTPHNVAQDLMNEIVAEQAVAWEACPEGALASVMLDQTPVWFFKAKSYVNLTGHEVASLLRRLGGSPEDCLVLTDDVALSLGAARLKRDGGDGGHLGMRSIMSALGTDEIPRIKIGVGRGGDIEADRKRVRERFSDEDAARLAPALKEAGVKLAAVVAEIAADQRRVAVREPDAAPAGVADADAVAMPALRP